VDPYDQDRPMKGYGQFCPMARASELVAQRWTTVIIRNLLAGATTFGGILDGAPGLSKTLLSQRLQQLERHRVIRRSPNPNGRGHTYHLTDIGMELAPVLEALGTWGTRWLDLDAEHLDPYPVLWDISKLIAQEDLPERRVVIRFDITDRRWRNRFWLVLEPHDREVCTVNPGWTEDLVIRLDSRSLAEWHIGDLGLREAMRDGRIHIEGPPRLTREFERRWQGLSFFARVERPLAREG